MNDSVSNAASHGEYAVRLAAQVREKNPLIHHITNYVVMNFTANVTLALGGQPIMAHAPQEVGEMQAFCSCLLLNIGTLDGPWIDGMLAAAKAATRLAKPIVLDPVGVGATKLRTDTARRILDEADVKVVRGNAGEVLALSGDSSMVRGVDSLADTRAVLQVAQNFAKKRGIVVVVTGVTDVVTDGDRVLLVDNGHEMMSRVTGTGCACSTAVACFIAASGSEKKYLEASASALAVFGRAGEMAAQTCRGSGTFVPEFIDALFNGDRAIGASDLKISEKKGA